MPPVGYGIIGCGNIGPIHAAAIADVRGAKLVGVADVVRSSARKLRAVFFPSGYKPALCIRDLIFVVKV